MYVRDWMARRAASSPDKTAAIDFATGATLSYRQLNERATRLANFLRLRAGVGSGDRIAVLSMNRAEILEALFAAAKLTAILVPLNYRLTQPELQYILEDCDPKVLIYEQEFQPIVSRLRRQTGINHCVVLDGVNIRDLNYEQAIAEVTDEPVTVEHFDAEMPLVIIYTSGTTGRPKGALLSHRMLMWNSINTNIGWDIVSTDVTTVHAPLFHTGGLNVLTTPLLHIGGTLVILRKFDADEVLEAIERYRCTVFFGVPTMFQMMMDSPRFDRTDFSSIRYFISGGAPCPIPLIEAYQRRGVAFTQGFGLTEVGPNCFRLGLEDAVRKAGSIGLPSFHSEARIVDEGGRDVECGQVGELILSGLHVCSGYWQNSEATAAALVDGWFYTGDLARRDEDGYYYIVGRAKDMIISGGENIYPAEVEAVLHNHPAIASAAVIGVADVKWGETPVAAVVARAGHCITAEEIIAFCADRLARYKIPRRIFFVDEFPLSGSGKVAKRMLKEEIEKRIA
ncbi:MAG TPA: long-chain fatty acid--CoA ligase [Blastocatellia bacterium]|nr:long-chain fatty acid--CoA ligase [Blastocatellia bacterium]